MAKHLLLWTLLHIFLCSIRSQDVPSKSQRWVISGEPYQQKVVGLIPGNAMQPSAWGSMPPPPFPPPFPIQQQLPLLPSIPSPYPISPPYFPFPVQSSDSQQPWFMQSPANLQRSPWPPIPWAPSLPEPQSVWPPGAPWTYVAPPTTVITGPQESSSRDLDVGVYTGMDTPWTQLPPFSKTLNAPQVGGIPRGPVTLQPWESSSRDLDVGVLTGNEQLRTWPAYQTWQADPRLMPYPWMRQQGGFGLKRDNDDLKLTMHVPQDGLPGGVLVMEMKASVYKPVY